MRKFNVIIVLNSTLFLFILFSSLWYSGYSGFLTILWIYSPQALQTPIGEFYFARDFSQTERFILFAEYRGSTKISKTVYQSIWSTSHDMEVIAVCQVSHEFLLEKVGTVIASERSTFTCDVVIRMKTPKKNCYLLQKNSKVLILIFKKI